MSAPVFVVDRAVLAGGRVVLDGPEGRHAATVRRLRAGEEVVLTDGAGLRGRCSVVSVGRDRLELEVLDRQEEAEPSPRITVVQALPKGERGELAVEVMTEAGVDEIIPWSASRSITQWRPERREKSLARWRNTAREAGKQARRSRFPVVADLSSTPQVAARLKQTGLALILHEEATEQLSQTPIPGPHEIVLVVGPEGGITPEELETFTTAGATPVRLGPTVLRTSTAGVAAAAVLMSRTGRW